MSAAATDAGAPGLTLELDAERQAVHDAVAVFCREECSAERVRAVVGRFDRPLWEGLAGLGVLAIGTPEGEGGVLEWVAAAEALGRAAFPGPLVETALAAALLPEPVRVAVGSGAQVVSVGEPPLLAWAPVARVFVVLDPRAGRAWLARPRGAVEPLDTLGGEPWGRVELERERELEGAGRGLDRARIVSAALLAGLGRRLVDDASEHARTRRQFGRTLGEFQAVAHPLAQRAIELDASAALARVAALHHDEGAPAAPALAAAARLAARGAALEAAATAHQVFGAVGVTVEGPAFFASRRVRQLASAPLGDAPARETVLARHGSAEPDAGTPAGGAP